MLRGISEVKCKVVFNRRIFKNPLNTIVKGIVFLFDILITNRQMQDVLVEGRSEIHVKEVAVIESFCSDTTDELEVC